MLRCDAMITTLRLSIVEATEKDIETIISIESHKENRDFLWIGTNEEHKAEIEDKNHLLWVFRTKDDSKVIGYALARIDKKSEIFELRRIAITDKGLGYGKEAMKAILNYAFEELGTNRFWLDVYPDNLKGIRLYEGLGMHCDGVLRQNYKSSRGYLDQIIYSTLKSEYYCTYVKSAWFVKIINK
jgi:[ribosomal protein S5]-alanine N-acetyltransferase